MSANPWEPWLAELEGACDAGDGGRARAVLEDLWRFPFHEEREREPERTPPLREMVAMLTAREIERPGVAGPFFSNWYAFGIEDFERRSEVEVEDWFCTILANRQHSDSQAPRPSYHYRFLHPAGERRGFVGRRSLDAAADLFFNLSPRPGGGNDAYAAVLYPPPGETFDAAAAAACLEHVLPESMRGEILPYGIPGDDGKPGLYVHGRSANARYRCGALVELRGDVAAQRWKRIRILWHGLPGAWRPEVPG